MGSRKAYEQSSTRREDIDGALKTCQKWGKRVTSGLEGRLECRAEREKCMLEWYENQAFPRCCCNSADKVSDAFPVVVERCHVSGIVGENVVTNEGHDPTLGKCKSSQK